MEKPFQVEGAALKGRGEMMWESPGLVVFFF